MQTARRLYLYLLAGIGLGVLVSGLSLLLTTLFHSLGLGGGDVLAGEQAVRERLTLATAMTVVALPVWLIHWFVADRSVRPGRADADLERSSGMRGLFFALVLGGLLSAMFASASALVEALVLAALGEAGDFRDPAGDLGLLIAASAAWGYHVRVRLRDWALGPIVGAGAWLPRAYLYIASFAGLFVALFGIADLLTLVSRLAAGDSDPVFGGDQAWWSYPLAGALSRILVGGATWLGHWWYANRLRSESSPRAAAERSARLRYAYLVAVLVVASAATIGYLGQGLSGALGAALGALDDGGRVAGELIGSIVASALLAFAWVVHARWLRRAATELDGPGHGAGERLVAYPTALVGLAFGSIAGARLLGQLFDVIVGGAPVLAGGESAVEVVADFLPFALLGLLVWLWQWARVVRARREAPIDEGASTVRRTALLLVLAASILAGVAALGTILYQLFGALFGLDVPGDVLTNISIPLGALVVAVVVAAYHGQLLRRDAAPCEAVEAAAGSEPATATVDLPLILSVPADADPTAVASVRRAMEERLPEGYRLRDDDRRMS